MSQYSWGGNEKYDVAFIVSGVDVRNLDDVVRMQRVTRYMISQGKAVAEDARAIRLALPMDVVRETTYGRNDAGRRKAQKLNIIVAEAARVTGVPFLDLTETDHAAQAERFEYPYDWHWNRHANRLVGGTLADLMIGDRTFTID